MVLPPDIMPAQTAIDIAAMVTTSLSMISYEGMQAEQCGGSKMPFDLEQE